MIKRSLLLTLILISGSLQAQDNAPRVPDLEKAKETANTICIACHNADGNSVLSTNPKLAGQVPEYIYKQLRELKSWNNEPAVRENLIMQPMAGLLEDDEMYNMAYYFASQVLQPAEPREGANLELGQSIWRAGIAAKGVPACTGCHGPYGAGMPAEYPQLGGQFPEYVSAQIKLFRDSERQNDLNSVMRTIALKMTDPEIEAVADYASSLRH